MDLHASSTTNLLLRIGLAFAFIYPPLSALIDPYAWVGYLPDVFLSLPVESMVLLHIFGLIELIIGILLLLDFHTRKVSAVAGVILFVIVAYHYKQMDVLFRDIPILLMAVALALSNKRS
jgi:uncharacterized membrane protein YphA (DoxX/SURF4 family)